MFFVSAPKYARRALPMGILLDVTPASSKLILTELLDSASLVVYGPLFIVISQLPSGHKTRLGTV
jgi:hypothetical protein